MKFFKYRAKWTDALLEQLAVLAKEGLGNDAISIKLFGTTDASSAVAGKIFRKNLRGTRQQEAPPIKVPKPIQAKAAPQKMATVQPKAKRYKALPPPPLADVSQDVAAGEPMDIVAPLPISKPPDVEFIARKDHPCVWPIGEPGEKGFHFCNVASVITKHRNGERKISPYCEEHTLASLSRYSSRPKKPADDRAAPVSAVNNPPSPP